MDVVSWQKIDDKPGAFKVTAYKNGREWAQVEMKTTGPAAALALTADRTDLAADGAESDGIESDTLTITTK